MDDDNDGYGDANEVYGTCGSCDSDMFKMIWIVMIIVHRVSPTSLMNSENSGIDEDCDGLTDEKEPYQDRDGDGYSGCKEIIHDGNATVMYTWGKILL